MTGLKRLPVSKVPQSTRFLFSVAPTLQSFTGTSGQDAPVEEVSTGDGARLGSNLYMSKCSVTHGNNVRSEGQVLNPEMRPRVFQM